MRVGPSHRASAHTDEEQRGPWALWTSPVSILGGVGWGFGDWVKSWLYLTMRPRGGLQFPYLYSACLTELLPRLDGRVYVPGIQSVQ